MPVEPKAAPCQQLRMELHQKETMWRRGLSSPT